LVRRAGQIADLNSVSQTFEQRVETPERRFSELSARLVNLRRSKKDWRATGGTLQADEMTQEADRLGRKYRTQQTSEKEIAGS
jgi:hypothetical protein